MHYFYDFKGFKSANIDLLRPMTLLIGRNGSGKTNVIEGVELLAQLASGRPLHEISEVGRGGGNAFEIRGGLSGCMRKKGEDHYIPFGLAFDTVYLENKIPISYRIDIDFIPPKILKEVLFYNKKNYFEASIKKNSDDLLNITYDNFSRGGKKPITQLPANRSILSRYDSVIAPLYEKKKSKVALNEAMTVASLVIDHLKSAYVFDFHPLLMRQYESISSVKLNRHGSNLSAVLNAIKQHDETQEESQQLLPKILDTLKQLPEEPYTGFEFFTTPTNHVLFALKREDGSFIDASLLSDGTLRALAILVALETVPAGSRIIIEELDNGIHPSRAKLLVDTIWECSRRRKLNVLATTHNPATLNGLTAEQLDCVEVCHYDSAEQADKITPLSKLPFSDVLLQKGQLGDLMTQNVLETYLMPNFERDQKNKVESWLELF